MAYSGANGEIYDRIRKDGYVVVTGDRIPGLVGISAPVWRAGNQLAGALTLTTLEQRMQPWFVDELRKSAEAASRLLGGE